MTTKAPRGVRQVITLIGRRNAGKSSLINAITGQQTAIVSAHPGTTTDPVAKHYELLPLGPVTFYDTAGLDDTGELGDLRTAASRKVLLRSDMALMVVGEEGVTKYEKEMAATIRDLGIPMLVIFNKVDVKEPWLEDQAWCRQKDLPYMEVSAKTGHNVVRLRRRIVEHAQAVLREEPLLAADLISEGDWVLCVVPLDLAAPKGRLILPQVQMLREILDSDALALTVKEREIGEALAGLNRKPALVITDSQVIHSVAGDVPEDVPLTTFSTLFARYKGDLEQLVAGAQFIDDLCDGDTILISEACSHHPVADDIGRVKIPRWMTQYTGRDLHFEVVAGHDFPDDLEKYRLVVHCGACMLNRMEMLRRMEQCARRGVPITNYGVAISKVQGVLERVIAPFGLQEERHRTTCLV